MPAISGMVLVGQNPQSRINDVINGATWITPQDASLVNQGRGELFSMIGSENWEPPFVWNIRWTNIPAQEAQQSFETDIEGAVGLV